MATPAILRKDHSLIGRNPLPVVRALRGFKGELPSPLARLRRDHSLDKYQPEELVQQIEGILGIPAGEVLEMAGVEGAEDPTSVAKDNLVFCLHVCICEANAKGQPRGAPLTLSTTQDMEPSSPKAGPSGETGSQGARKEEGTRKVRPIFSFVT